MSVRKLQVVDGSLGEEAWKLYRQSFDPLRYVAVQRHVLYDHEFDAVMLDPRVDKYLEWADDGSLRGVATMTNQLHSMPLVSPEYFEQRWPDRYAAGEVFYIGFLGVHPHAHGTGAFADMVKAMTEVVAGVDGVAVLDVCNHNKDRLHLPRAIRMLASTWASHVEMAPLDAQTYVGYDFKRAG
ncbi:MAG: hypothetical protein ACRDV1_03025 [Actinomycetes bacterium]